MQHSVESLPINNKTIPTNTAKSKNPLKNSIISSDSSFFKEKLGAFKEVNSNNRRTKNPSSGNSQVLSLSRLNYHKSQIFHIT